MTYLSLNLPHLPGYMTHMQQEIIKSSEIGQAFQTFITTLEKNQVEYDLGSENIIKDMGSVQKREIYCRPVQLFNSRYPSYDGKP